MTRSPLAPASLLAIALAVSACDNSTPTSTPIPAPAASALVSTGPTTAATGVLDEVAVRAVVHHYTEMVYAAFDDAHTGAEHLQAAVDAFLTEPNAQTLKAARDAWVAARPAYLQTEVFRFGNTIIDDWEGQVNAWPLDEGLIDYTDKHYAPALGNPGASANIIANTHIQVGEDLVDVSQITPQLLASLNELGGSEANVATGYHAIEFLLWGQDLNGTGPGAGNRPASDYLEGPEATGGHNDRRRAYLKAATDLLVSDLGEMVGNWQPGADNYRAALDNEPVDSGLRKMLFGMGSLSLGELAGERLKVALEAHSPEDEHDCFSDNTHNSAFYNAKGIRNVYLGVYERSDGSPLAGPSLSSLVAKIDPATDTALKNDLAQTELQMQVLVDLANQGEHFDQLIAPGNTVGNQHVRNAIAALVKQTAGIEQVADKLGITDLNPETAEHQF